MNAGSRLRLCLPIFTGLSKSASKFKLWPSRLVNFSPSDHECILLWQCNEASEWEAIWCKRIQAVGDLADCSAVGVDDFDKVVVAVTYVNVVAPNDVHLKLEHHTHNKGGRGLVMELFSSVPAQTKYCDCVFGIENRLIQDIFSVWYIYNIVWHMYNYVTHV